MADDTTFYLHNKDTIEAENIINTFSLFSTLRLNAKKTKVMKLGYKKNEREDDCRENKDSMDCFWNVDK